MGPFSILTNRKRAIVALVHSVVFLSIAVRQMVTATRAAGFGGHLDSLRNIRHRLHHSLPAPAVLAQLDGEILFCLLHLELDLGLAANYGR
jgi:hypothetical protein